MANQFLPEKKRMSNQFYSNQNREAEAIIHQIPLLIGVLPLDRSVLGMEKHWVSSTKMPVSIWVSLDFSFFENTLGAYHFIDRLRTSTRCCSWWRAQVSGDEESKMSSERGCSASPSRKFRSQGECVRALWRQP